MRTKELRAQLSEISDKIAYLERDVRYMSEYVNVLYAVARRDGAVVRWTRKFVNKEIVKTCGGCGFTVVAPRDNEPYYKWCPACGGKIAPEWVDDPKQEEDK